MWRNEEVHHFVDWLRQHNATTTDRPAGFYGLDLYSMYTSMGVVLGYLADVDPAAAKVARSRYAQLIPRIAETEGRLSPHDDVLQLAEEAVLGTLRDLLQKRLDYVARGPDRFFDATQNARVVTSSERYYRAIYRGAAASWNLRDSHMFDTLRTLLAHHGATSKAIVWAHNTHVGDARATEMHRRGEHDLGQLCRQAFGDAVRLVGFGTDHGTVAAADDWDEPVRIKSVNPGHPESYEHVMHETGLPAFVLALRNPARSAVREELSAARLLRAIGVIYRPQTELASHYFESVLPKQFDELVWVDETRAVKPLAPISKELRADLPETYPFGL
jgi:protein-L-isoaspartate(D-aspartate) O-methyltransferase